MLHRLNQIIFSTHQVQWKACKTRKALIKTEKMCKSFLVVSKLADNTPAISCTEACLGEVPEDVVLERRHLAHPRLSLTTRCQNRRKLAGGQLFGAYNV